ncbi:MAG: hypothetical protein AAB683_01740 [Patescibacteria group bacterium]
MPRGYGGSRRDKGRIIGLTTENNRLRKEIRKLCEDNIELDTELRELKFSIELSRRTLMAVLSSE